MTLSSLLFQYLNDEIPDEPEDDGDAERYATKIRARTETVIKALKGNIDALAEMLENRVVTVKYENRHREITRALTRISDSFESFIHHGDLVYWLEEGAIPAGIAEGDVPASNNRWLAAARSFQNPAELTREMLEAVVERIVITDPENIDVIWKFKDEFKLLESCASAGEEVA